MGDAYPESPADGVLFALADRGRLGRKAGAGFYAYDDKGKRQGLWPDLRDLWPPRPEAPALTEVQHRLAMIQTLEAVRALEDGVLTDIREGDVGAILGWGFMPWSGGPFSWLDILGAAKAVEDLRRPRRRPRRPLRRPEAPARPRTAWRDLLRTLRTGREGRLIGVGSATCPGSGASCSTFFLRKYSRRRQRRHGRRLRNRLGRAPPQASPGDNRAPAR